MGLVVVVASIVSIAFVGNDVKQGENMQSLLLVCLAQSMDRGWKPGIGDPTFIGWFITFSYFAVSYLCFRNARNLTRRSGINSLTMTWWLITAVLVFLGFNKQLDLQSLITEIGRSVAIEQGWYENRRMVQKEFVLALAVGGFGVLLAWAWVLRRHFRNLRLVFIGMILLIVFIVGRAAVFYHADKLLGFRVTSSQIGWILELGSLALIGLGSYKRKS